MREIKFRAWNKASLKMVYYDKDVSAPDMTLNGVLISHLTNSNVSYKYILMQFTGLKDKNGTEIYEGDCFKTSDKHGYSSNCIVEVLWDEDSCAFVAQVHRHDELEVGAELLDSYKRNFPDSFVIIGNIQQSPELLED